MENKDEAVQITISKETYEELCSLVCMLKASGINYNQLLTHDKAIKYLLTHRPESWAE